MPPLRPSAAPKHTAAIQFILERCKSLLGISGVAEQVIAGEVALDHQQLPRTLLMCAGIVILVAEPAWLAINGQLSLAVLSGMQPFQFNVITWL